MEFSNVEAARALVNVLSESKWEAVSLAHGYVEMLEGKSAEEAARVVFERGPQTLKKSRELLLATKEKGFLGMLTLRERTGSAENPITKLFPATITEQRFSEHLDSLCSKRKSLTYTDERESGHTLSDFKIHEDALQLPINIKNAGTRFERAQSLVGLDPDDCIPIPAYKAHNAISVEPNLLYIVSIDYQLIGKLNQQLPLLLTRDERIVWELLQRFSGSKLRNAEDMFVFAIVRKNWESLKEIAGTKSFFAISARKAIRILQTMPNRTPGIGLRAWGTGASAEVNVHISVKGEMKPWEGICDRMISKGIIDVIEAVNRKRVEEVYDPEI